MVSRFVNVLYKDMYNKKKLYIVFLILFSYGWIKKIFCMWVLYGEDEVNVWCLNVWWRGKVGMGFIFGYILLCEFNLIYLSFLLDMCMC